jgi:hypothetical protein
VRINVLVDLLMAVDHTSLFDTTTLTILNVSSP